MYWLRSQGHTRIQALLHARPDLVFAVSAMTRNQLVDDLGVSPTRVHVAYTGVSQEYFVASSAPHDELRLLFLGSLSREKDPMTALDVVDRLRPDCNAVLRFVGYGPLAHEVAAEIETRGLSAIVEMVGSVDDVRPHLEWADLLLLVSLTEGLPGAVIEAGAAGVPAVAFGVGGTAETMIPDRSGVIVSPGDTDAMVNTVKMLASNRARLESMGTCQREFVRTTFDLDEAIARYEELLVRAIDLEGNL